MYEYASIYERRVKTLTNIAIHMREKIAATEKLYNSGICLPQESNKLWAGLRCPNSTPIYQGIP